MISFFSFSSQSILLNRRRYDWCWFICRILSHSISRWSLRSSYISKFRSLSDFSYLCNYNLRNLYLILLCLLIYLLQRSSFILDYNIMLIFFSLRSLINSWFNLSNLDWFLKLFLFLLFRLLSFLVDILCNRLKFLPILTLSH